MKLIFLAIISLFTSCNRTGIYEFSPELLEYVNIKDSCVSFPQEMKTLQAENLHFDSTVFNVSTLPLDLSDRLEILGAMKDFLFEQDLINQWGRYKRGMESDKPVMLDSTFQIFYFTDDRRVYIDTMKQRQIDFYYWGKVEISPNFESNLFLKIEIKPMTMFGFNDYTILRGLYLFNSNQEQIRSITLIASYVNIGGVDGGIFHNYTQIQENKIFLISDEILSSDVIVPENYVVHNYFKFKFDDRGYVKTDLD